MNMTSIDFIQLYVLVHVDFNDFLYIDAYDLIMKFTYFGSCFRKLKHRNRQNLFGEKNPYLHDIVMHTWMHEHTSLNSLFLWRH